MVALAVVVVLAIPLVVLIGLLRLVDARQRRREEAIARQIVLTDAIHADLGPVVAPVVRRGRGGRFTVVLPVAAGRTDVARIVDVTHATLGAAVDIVLVPPPPAAPRGGRGRRPQPRERTAATMSA
jgi:hypothetical protein